MKKPLIPFKTYDEFWEYCTSGRCPNRGFGCAKTCTYRRQLKIPPFGEKYKLHGEIRYDGEEVEK